MITDMELEVFEYEEVTERSVAVVMNETCRRFKCQYANTLFCNFNSVRVLLSIMWHVLLVDGNPQWMDLVTAFDTALSDIFYLEVLHLDSQAILHDKVVINDNDWILWRNNLINNAADPAMINFFIGQSTKTKSDFVNCMDESFTLEEQIWSRLITIETFLMQYTDNNNGLKYFIPVQLFIFWLDNGRQVLTLWLTWGPDSLAHQSIKDCLFDQMDDYSGLCYHNVWGNEVLYDNHFQFAVLTLLNLHFFVVFNQSKIQRNLQFFIQGHNVGNFVNHYSHAAKQMMSHLTNIFNHNRNMNPPRQNQGFICFKNE